MSHPAIPFLLVAVALNLIAKPSHGGLIHPGNDDVHIAMGASRNYVGAFSRGSDPGNVSFAGSITLIDDGRWGLTTRHQLFQNAFDSTTLYASFAANFGNNIIDNPGATFRIEAVFIHPQISKEMALVYFGTPVPGITPVQRFRGTVDVGAEGYITGFGNREYVTNDNTPNAVFTGDRRSGFDVIESTNVANQTFRTRVNESFEPNYRPFEMGGRVGDSGGAFVVGNELYGLMYAGSTASLFGISTFYQMLDNDWIDAQQSSVPEPTSFALLGFSLTALARSRRRRTFRA